MHWFSHLQWWSNTWTHLLHTEQCLVLTVVMLMSQR